MAGRGMTFGAPMGWGKGGKGAKVIVKSETGMKKKEPEKGAREVFGSAAKKEEPQEEGPKLVVGEGAFRPGGAKEMSEEEVVRKKVMGLLNKMAPEKYTALSEQVVSESKVLEDDKLLRQTLDLIFKRATSQQDLCSMFANLCKFIGGKMSDDRSKAYKRALLETVQSEYEELRKMGQEDVPKKKRLGNAQFVGELFAKGMLNGKVMLYILGNLVPPTAEDAKCEAKPCHTDIEVFCKLLGTAGGQLDKDAAANEAISGYFRTFKALASNADYPPRIRFMMLDTEGLRARNWPDTNAKALTIADQQKIEEQKVEKSMQMNIGDKGHTGAATAWGSSAEIVAAVSEKAKETKKESKKDKDGDKKKKKKKNK